MGLFDFIGDAASIAVRTTVSLPVAIIKDTVTLGGSLIDEDSAVASNLSKTIQQVEKLPDSIQK